MPSFTFLRLYFALVVVGVDVVVVTGVIPFGGVLFSVEKVGVGVTGEELDEIGIPCSATGGGTVAAVAHEVPECILCDIFWVPAVGDIID